MTQDELYAKWDEIVGACEEYGDDPYPAWMAFLVNFGEQNPIPGPFDFIKYSFDIKENHATRQHTVSIHP